MCLDSITKKPRKHKGGYKIFQKSQQRSEMSPYKDETEEDKFIPQMMPPTNEPYELGMTYDAKFGKDSLPILKTEGGSYEGGFHYHLKLKDAKAMVCLTCVVIKITVTNILATGKQHDYDVGVAEFMTLDKIMYDAEKSARQQRIAKEKKDFNEFRKICKQPVQQKMISFLKKRNDPSTQVLDKDYSDFTNFLTQSEDILIEAVVFMYYFPRDSLHYKQTTEAHLWGFKNNKQYKKMASHIMDLGGKGDPRLRDKKYEKYSKFLKDDSFFKYL